MKLTKKQKNFIKENLNKLSVKQIAKELKVDVQTIQKYINTIKEKVAQKPQIKLKYHLISCSIISAIIVIVYFNSLHSPFMYDDYSTIVNNHYIKDFKNFRYIFTPHYFTFLPKEHTALYVQYRILSIITFIKIIQ